MKSFEFIPGPLSKTGMIFAWFRIFLADERFQPKAKARRVYAAADDVLRTPFAPDGKKPPAVTLAWKP